MCPRFSFAAYSPSAKQFKMCYCVVICFLNNQCFIGSRRNASPLPYKIRADPHWALTQGLSFLGRLALFVGVLVASKQVTFKKDEISLAPGWVWWAQLVSPGLAEMVAPGLALRVGNGWMFPFLLTFQRVLSRAQHHVWVHQQHLSFHSCCLCSLWIFMLGQLSTASWKES